MQGGLNLNMIPTAKIHRTRVHINIHRYMRDVLLSLHAFPVLSIHSNGFTEIKFLHWCEFCEKENPHTLCWNNTVIP